jgi:imidazole glycerol-phosphate synthase subunit HisH
MIALIDYGAGNVRSVHKALVAVGAEVALTHDPAPVLAAEKVVLPGVGAFADCMESLMRMDLVAPIREVIAAGIPFLGICVGMQVLFEHGEELGGHEGLGLLPGRVVAFPRRSPPGALKVPHTGWNQVEAIVDTPLLADVPQGAWAYFNHGFFCRALPEDTLATTDYGGPYASVVGRGSLLGVQFHPEKSQAVGLQLMRNFVARVRGAHAGEVT